MNKWKRFRKALHAKLNTLRTGREQPDKARRGQGDVLGCFRHQIFSTTGVGSHSPDLTPRHPSNPQPFPLFVRLDRGQDVQVGCSMSS